MLGEECNVHHEFKAMFLQIRKEAIIRLHATSSGLQLNQPWIHRLHGGFNEQALSNIVYAYDKTQLLDKELLQWVFNIAALRLDRMDAKEPSFKPQVGFGLKKYFVAGQGPDTDNLFACLQELCTLLRASHQYIAQPWAFLAKLLKVVQTMPWIISSWSAAELTELSRAFSLLRSVAGPMMQQQQQQMQQVARLQAQVQAQLPFPGVPPALYGTGELHFANACMLLLRYLKLNACQLYSLQALKVLLSFWLLRRGLMPCCSRMSLQGRMLLA